MESLLRWSIQNSTPGAPAPPPERRTALDPAIIDHILGRPDAAVMRDALALALDPVQPEDARVAALDEFEMLVEHIDNASDMEKLGMWAPLHGLLTAPDAPDGVRRQALWALGTAVQNNPSAQAAYLSLSPLPTLLALLDPGTTPAAPTRAKAVYALSGALKHSAAGVAQLGAARGWPALRAALADSDIGVRRKAAFLLGALLVPSGETSAPQNDGTGVTGTTLHSQETRPDAAPVHPNTHASMLSDPSSTDTSTPTLAALHEHGLLDALVSALAQPVPHGPDGDAEPDVDFEEKVLAVLATYVHACRGTFNAEQKAALRAFVAQDPSGERWGLSADELRAFHTAL